MTTSSPGTSTTRVRFAPSPTGFLHVGSARAALFNWLFARHTGGTFVLRIEDTDAERNREEWIEAIPATLAWLGMAPDEGPYRQSERLAGYRAAIDLLWEGGRLYSCDCTRKDVEARAEERARAAGGKRGTPGYDGFCRDRGLERGPGRALRFRTPDEGETLVEDLVRGEVRFPHAAMEDFVVARASGQPLFVLCNAVDDRDMGITHVIRGEDLLSSTPKGLLLWEALDGLSAGPDGRPVPLPAFAHLPLLVNEQRKKLSKRREEVAVEAFRDQGYLPEAFRNYLALLGWSPPGDEEKVPLEVLVGTFSLGDVNSAPAFFDVQKLRHLNGEYVRELSVGGFTEAVRPWVDPDGCPSGSWLPEARPPWPPERFDAGRFERLAPLVQERVAVLGEAPAMVDFVFLADPVIDEKSWGKAVARDELAPRILRAAVEAYSSAEWSAEALHQVTAALAEEVGRSLGKAQAPIRVAVTGRTVGPPLFESLAVLGREEVLRRLQSALERRESEGDVGVETAGA